MSTQLILYPQKHNGLNPISMLGTEYYVQGTNWFGFNASLSLLNQSFFSVQTFMNNFSNGAPVNTFRRFSGTTNFCAKTGGVIILPGDSGFIQRLSNLTPGQLYQLEIESNGGTQTAYHYNLATSQNGFSYGGVGTHTFTFNAVSNNDDFIVIYASTGSVVISVSVQEAGVIADVDVSTGEVILDLYEEEEIPLTLSADEFKNAGEQVQSYSKAFNLPGTKRNNKIFDNIFEITRADDGIVFNPYIKSQSILKQDGFVLFDGYLRLIDIIDNQGEISYSVNLYSEVTALADVIKDRTFKDINFYELQHEYNKTQIFNSWNDSGTGITYPNANTSGYRDANATIKYPFCDWDHQFILDTNGNPELQGLGNAFRPWIQARYLIDRIFQDTPFTFTSSFFDEDGFKKLYVDFNWGEAQEPNSALAQGTGTNASTTGITAGTSYTRVQFDTEDMSSSSKPELGYDNSNSRFTAQFDNQLYTVNVNSMVFTYQGYSGSGYDEVGVMAFEKFNSGGVSQGEVFGSYMPIVATAGGASFNNIGVGGTFEVFLNSGEFIIPSFKRFTNITSLTQTPTSLLGFPQPSNSITVTTGVSDITSEVLLENMRGEQNQWEFLKGIMTMFNLVSMPDKQTPGNLLIEPYSDVFVPDSFSGSTSDLSLASRSIQHDWTTKIDISQIKMKPLTDLNKITKFSFEEDEDDYAFSVYKNSTSGFLYGSAEFDAKMYTILTGEKEIKATPFAATIVKPLDPEFNDFITPSIYSYSSEDGTSSGFNNKIRICFNNGVKTLTSCTYKIPTQNGVTGTFYNQFLQFSHLTSVPSVVSSPPDPATDTRDFNFGECQYFSGVGNTTSLNLFNLFWFPYFMELYHPDTRIMTIKVNLTPGDITNFQFNDTVFVKNRSFRVNKIDYKPKGLSTVEFILIP
ncbi:MAG: hypothetical protein Unbinned6316contig1000_3 [Prokaryotic dsDNA virus sp.]|nr:MAG: hypothetical protein Unbinned6316contig1000_3 [Prokaryotic dsDNA virus sp.]|tara:strand:- start:1458 stop:4199 length:2742 start_codon:yes stop_codon:yes gene_type:complete